jgi:hypothetical protein
VKNTEHSAFIIAGIVSLGISYFIYTSIDVINPDAVCYLKSANAMQLGLQYAMHLCGQAVWPFYSFLIWQVAQLSHFSVDAAAFSLNAAFSLLIVWFFMGIVRALSPKQSPWLLWIAAFVIITAKTLNEVRQYIVRDHGYWAFSLLAILLLIYFMRRPRWSLAIAWGSASALAMLFRIEGAFFLIAIPFLVWFNQTLDLKKRISAFLQLNTINVLGGLALLGWIMTHPAQDIGRFKDLSLQNFLAYFANIKIHIAHLQTYVLSHYAHSEAASVLIIMVLGWYVLAVVKNLSVLQTGLIGYAWYKKTLRPSQSEQLVLWGYILINVSFTLFFLFQYLFLSKRYLVGLSLILLLWVPSLILTYRSKRVLQIFILAMLVLGGKSIFVQGYSKAYIKDAGEWVKLHVPNSASFYTNDLLVMYYSEHFGDAIFQERKRMQADRNLSNAEYVALRVNKKDSDTQQATVAKLQLSPVIVFANARGDQVRIYKRG